MKPVHDPATAPYTPIAHHPQRERYTADGAVYDPCPTNGAPPAPSYYIPYLSAPYYPVVSGGDGDLVGVPRERRKRTKPKDRRRKDTRSPRDSRRRHKRR
jgi:hypothetical protein